MENKNDECKNHHFFGHFFIGGMMKYIPKNEAQIYMAKFTIDVANYCFTDFSTKDLNEVEIECTKRLAQKNNEFINL